jgi:small subunit ribosomal protein S16
MVRIRLRQVGSKNQASFRVVAADKESPRNGRFIEILGYYNPRTQPATIQLKEERIYGWISKGAQPSESATAIFRTAGLTERYERYKSGEKLETLLAEAEAAAESRNTNPKTRLLAPVTSKKPRKKAAVEESVAPTPAKQPEPTVEEPQAEAAQPEAPVKEPQAEAAQPDAAQPEAPVEDPQAEAAKPE